MKKTIYQWLNKLGPGLITGAADDDPTVLLPILRAERNMVLAHYGRYFLLIR